jgi:ATP-dependent DNA helicase RecG
MLQTELLEIITNGENSGVEFKRDDIRPEQLAKEVVALANLRGGIILLGVEDDGTISGIQRDNLEEWVMDTVFTRYIHPLILPFYEVVRMEDGKKVAIISFPQGTSKPYVLRHNDREDIFIRLGSTSRIATREQQARLFESGGILHSELIPVPGTSLQSLDLERIRNYLEYFIKDPDIPELNEEWEKRLIAFGFLVEVHPGLIACTIAGLVLFGLNPRRYLKQAGIRFVVYNSDDKEYHTDYDGIIDGPMVSRYFVDEKNGNLKVIDSGIIDRFSDILLPYISQDEDELIDSFQRKKIWNYPLGAVRETVINALSHRDWTRFIDIEVNRFIDRIEVVSPGTLPNSMNIEKMITGQRSPRNNLIVDTLRDYGYVDSKGMGIKKKVIPLMKLYNQTDPIFLVTDDYVKTILYRKQGL